MAGGTENVETSTVREKLGRALKRIEKFANGASKWYDSLSPGAKIALSLAVLAAATGGVMLGGAAGLGLLTLATVGKAALTYLVSVRMAHLGARGAEAMGYGKTGQYVLGFTAATATALLGGWALSHYADSLLTHDWIGMAAGTSPVPSPETIAQATLNGVNPHQLPNGQWVIHRGGYEYTWDGKTWTNPHRIVASAEMAGAATPTPRFSPENAAWLRQVGLKDNEIAAIHAYGFNDEAVAKWKAAGFTPHVSDKAVLTFTNAEGKVWTWDAANHKMVEGTPTTTAAPTPETTGAKACTGLTAVVESKGAQGCDGSEALLMDLAKKLVAAGATADTYEQGTVLDRLVEAQLQGKGALTRMASVLSQELGMLNPKDHLDSANIWDNARLRVEGTKLTLVGPGTGPNGDLLADCTKIDGFDGKMIHTTACGEAPAAAPAPEAPVVKAEVVPEPVTPPPPPEPEVIVPPIAEVPVEKPETCEALQWYAQTNVVVLRGHLAPMLALVYHGSSLEDLDKYLDALKAEGFFPDGYQQGLAHRTIWVQFTDCDTGQTVWKCWDVDEGNFTGDLKLTPGDGMPLRPIRSQEEFFGLLEGTHDYAATNENPKDIIPLTPVDTDGDGIANTTAFEGVSKETLIERQLGFVWEDVFGSNADPMAETVASSSMPPEFIRELQSGDLNDAARVLERTFGISHEKAMNLAGWIRFYSGDPRAEMINGEMDRVVIPFTNADGSPKTFAQFISEAVSKNADAHPEYFPVMNPNQVGVEVPQANIDPEGVNAPKPEPKPIESPYQGNATQTPAEYGNALKAVEASFRPIIDDAKLIGNFNISFIMATDPSTLSNLTPEQVEAWNEVKRALLENKDMARRYGAMTLSQFMQNVLGVTVTD